MHAEHWIYSLAIAITIYTIYEKKYVLSIITLSSYAPDVDYISSILRKFGIIIMFEGHPIKHGDFHNILVLLIYALFLTMIFYLTKIKIRIIDSFIFSSIGFGAHLFEDALVYNPAYEFFWPFSNKLYDIGLIKYNTDLYGFADKDVLIIGIGLVFLSIIINIIIRGTNKNILNGRD
jgi:membrane-bound metal-dependent hydrolase YbcI (DUF457 family)